MKAKSRIRILLAVLLVLLAFAWLAVDIADDISRHEARALAPAGFTQDLPSWEPRPSKGD